MAKATKVCPYCAETVNIDAKKCKHCGEILDSDMRELDTLRKQKSAQVINVNAAASSAAAVTDSGAYVLRPYPHGWHVILDFLTGGVWIPVHILFYLCRNKNVYL